MPESLRFLLWGFLIGLFVGGYAITHLDETFNGIGTFYNYSRNHLIHSIHNEPNCPNGYTCTKAD